MSLFLGKLKRLVRKSEKSKEKSKFQLAPFLGQADMLVGQVVMRMNFTHQKAKRVKHHIILIGSGCPMKKMSHTIMNKPYVTAELAKTSVLQWLFLPAFTLLKTRVK